MVSVFAAVFLGIIFGVTLLIFTGVYNGLQAVKKQVERNWESIDHFLKNREAELPRFLNLIAQLAPQEKALVDKIRKHKEEGKHKVHLADKIRHSNEMTNLFSSLLLIGEAYPELRTHLEFRKIKSVLLEIEKQLENRQEHFNATLRVYNHKCQQFPDLVFAQTLGFSYLESFIVYEETEKQEQWELKVAA